MRATGAWLLAVVVAVLTTPVHASPASALPDWVDHSVSASSDQGGRRTLVLGVRVGEHDDFDRLVLDVRGPVPDLHTRYARRFRHEGTGSPVPIRGRSGIRLDMHASGRRADGTPAYEGARLARPGMTTLKAFAVCGDSEGWFSLCVALRQRAPHRVFWLTSPSRLVIDVRHP